MKQLIASRRAYMKLMTGRNPRRRPMPRAIPPKAVVTAYTRVMLDLVAVMRAVTARELYPKLRQHLAHARDLRGRTDAVDDDVALVKATLARGAFEKGNLKAIVKPMGRRTADWQKAQLERQLRASVGIDIPVRDPRLVDRIEAFTAENVALITSIPEEALGQVQKVVMRGMSAGDRWEDIADAIEKRFGVSESRAALIARDQVGRFYSALNEVRQRDLGLTHFFWRVALDERLCAICAPLDGKRFSWDKPPADGGPGEIHPQCRCSADPDVEGMLAEL
jgi:SPP1 gp7 family putative phage head morphogenesis protein